MATSTLKTRIQHKNGTPEEWSQATNFSPLKGELVVYNDATNPKMKIGDGETNVNDLPFINNTFTYDQITMPDGNKWNGVAGANVIIEPTITSGTKLATVSVDGVSKDLYYQTSAVTLNGAAATSASFYAPVDGGSAGQILLATGNNASPYWANTGTIFTKGITDSNGSTAYMGKDSTSGLWVEQDGKLCWMLERSGRTANELKVHYYNENGSWSDYGILLDSKNCSNYALPITGGTLTGDLKAKGQFQSQSTSTHQYPGLWIRNDENADIGAVYIKPSSNNNLNIRWKRDDGGGDGFYYLSCKAADGSVTAPKFVGPLQGTATKATQDGNGNVITSTYLPFAGGTLTGALDLANNVWNKLGDDVQFGDQNVAGGFVLQGLNGATNITFKQYGGSNTAKISYDGSSLSSSVAFYGAVWNDYAEYRNQNETIEPGYIAYCDDDGKLKKTTERLQKYEGVVSDTFGFAIGKTDDCKTPLAVSGRALVYCAPDEEHFHSGDCVCAGPDGLAYRMTREEIIEFPDRIVGVVSEIPTYETWGTGNVEVNGRIWIKVR